MVSYLPNGEVRAYRYVVTVRYDGYRDATFTVKAADMDWARSFATQGHNDGVNGSAEVLSIRRALPGERGVLDSGRWWH